MCKSFHISLLNFKISLGKLKGSSFLKKCSYPQVCLSAEWFRALLSKLPHMSLQRSGNTQCTRLSVLTSLARSVFFNLYVPAWTGLNASILPDLQVHHMESPYGQHMESSLWEAQDGFEPLVALPGGERGKNSKYNIIF